jgi:hypothetical protein
MYFPPYKNTFADIKAQVFAEIGVNFKCFKDSNTFCNGNSTIEINSNNTNCYNDRLIGTPGLGACSF